MNNLINMLDGANPEIPGVSKETLLLSDDVGNKTLSLSDRIVSFEDIMNLEVGDTSFTRARNLERESGIRQIFLKFEGNNPTGTQKDRIAFSQCHDALRRGFDTITVASCGNYGAAIALAAKLASLECRIFIPENYHTPRIEEMEAYGARVERFRGSYEEAVIHSIEQASNSEWYDANPGGTNTPLQIMSYAEIANEIYDVLRDAPKMVAVPVSNGTLLTGVYRGFVNLYKRGKTSRIPKMIAASSTHKNPIVFAYKKNLDRCIDLTPESIKETKINEPLINWHSFDGNEALYSIRASHGAAYDISDDKMLRLTRILKEKEGLHVLPASTAGLAALFGVHAMEELEADRYVVLLTGKK
jgi:threonine synthase